MYNDLPPCPPDKPAAGQGALQDGNGRDPEATSDDANMQEEAAPPKAVPRNEVPHAYIPDPRSSPPVQVAPRREQPAPTRKVEATPQKEELDDKQKREAIARGMLHIMQSVSGAISALIDGTINMAAQIELEREAQALAKSMPKPVVPEAQRYQAPQVERPDFVPARGTRRKAVDL